MDNSLEDDSLMMGGITYGAIHIWRLLACMNSN